VKTHFVATIFFALLAVNGQAGFVQAQQLPNHFKDAKPRLPTSPDVRPGMPEGIDAPANWPKLGAAKPAANTLYIERLQLLEQKLDLLEKRLNDIETRRK
jgi:hypothetical protein